MKLVLSIALLFFNLNARADQMITNANLSLSMPQGWNSLLVSPDAKKKIVLTEIKLSPQKEVSTSAVFVTLRKDDQPYSIQKTYAVHANGKLQKMKWQGHEWDVLEYPTVESVAATASNATNKVVRWLAVPASGNRNVVLLAGAPLESAEKYRAQILKVMGTVQIKK